MHLLRLHLCKCNHTLGVAGPILRIRSTDEEIQAHIDNLISLYETNVQDNETRDCDGRHSPRAGQGGTQDATVLVKEGIDS